MFLYSLCEAEWIGVKTININNFKAFLVKAPVTLTFDPVT